MPKTFKRPTRIIRKGGAANRTFCFSCSQTPAWECACTISSSFFFSTHSNSLHGNESKLCRPYGAKIIRNVPYPPLAQWATVVTPLWGAFCFILRSGRTGRVKQENPGIPVQFKMYLNANIEYRTRNFEL